jgi:hypothetical protein
MKLRLTNRQIDCRTNDGGIVMRMLPMIALGLLVLPASQAAAVCTQAKMQGVWQFHAINSVNNADGVNALDFVEKCQFRINAEGTIIEDSCATAEGSFFETFTFDVQSSCSVQLVIDFPCFYDGQFIGNQKLATGIGFCAGAADAPDPAYFSLVKGRATGPSAPAAVSSGSRAPRGRS